MIVVAKGKRGFELRDEGGELVSGGLTEGQAQGLAGYFNMTAGWFKRRRERDRRAVLEVVELLERIDRNFCMMEAGGGDCGVCNAIEKLGEILP